MATTSIFGKYVLLRKLASGGMGEVFLAKQRGPSGFEKHVVIKRILSHHLDKPDYVEMFFGEAKLVARLNHHNIVQIYEMGQIQGDHYIAMEYVRGKSLRDIIDQMRSAGRHLSLAHVVELAVKLCEGLGYAHEAADPRGHPLNIVHRDINPHNVLISYNGDLKIIDFGIAKSAMTSVHTATGTIKGKFVYMSPEQSAADPLDRRSDIFSLGIVLYELACLENPFVRQNIVLSLEAIQRHTIPPPSSKRGEATPLDEIVSRALSKDPADRFQDALEFRDALLGLFRAGTVRPADEDLGGQLQSLFAADIARDDELLREAEEAVAAQIDALPDVAPDSSDLIDANSALRSLPPRLPDEEPTLAGDPEPAPTPFIEAATVPDPLTPSPAPVAARVPAGAPSPSMPLPALPPLPDLAPAARPPSGMVWPDTPSRQPAVRGSSSARTEPFESVSEHRGSAWSSDSVSPLAEPFFDSAPVDPVDANDSSGLSFAVNTPQTPYASVGAVASPWRRRLTRTAAYAAGLLLIAFGGFMATMVFIDSPSSSGGATLSPATGPEGAPRADNDGRARGEKPSPTVTPVQSLRPSLDPAMLSPPVESIPPRGRDAVESPARPPTSKSVRIGRSSAESPQPRLIPPVAVSVPRGHPSNGKKVIRKTTAKTPVAIARAPLMAKTIVKRPPRAGQLTVSANRPIAVLHRGASSPAPAELSLEARIGAVEIRGSDLPFDVNLAYRLTSDGIGIRIESVPWSIVKHDGLSLGRTPQGPLAPARRHRLTFLKPGQPGKFELTLAWKPSP